MKDLSLFPEETGKKREERSALSSSPLQAQFKKTRRKSALTTISAEDETRRVNGMWELKSMMSERPVKGKSIHILTGGGLHGKDLSKADVSVNIWCYLESIRTGHQVTASCSIGDETVCGVPYSEIVEQARLYILTIGGFEKFAEWGLIRAKDL